MQKIIFFLENKWLKKLSLTTRFLITGIVAMFIVIFTSFIFTYINLRKFERKSKEHLISAQRTLETRIEELGESNLAIATGFAHMEGVREAILKRDPDLLYSRVSPIINKLNSKRILKLKIHFHIPPCRSFLRVWKPRKRGDDLSSFRFTVKHVLSSGESLIAIEPGRGGIPIRGIAPIKDKNGKVIASVEAFVTISDILKDFQSKTNYQTFLFTRSRVISTSISGLKIERAGEYIKLFGERSPFSEEELKKAEEGPRVFMKGSKYLLLFPLKGFSETAGIVGIVMDLSPIRIAIYKDLAVFFIINLFMAFVIAIIIKYTGRYNVKPTMEAILKNICQLSQRCIPSPLDPEKLYIKEIREIAERTKNVSANIGSLLKVFEVQGGELRRTQGFLIQSSSDQIAKVIEDISKAVSSTVYATGEAVDEARKAQNFIETLKSSTTRIKTVIDTIAKIANQTKLLALNANIEAARSGSAGKGFAVVANEIKELASDTTEALDEISQLVKEILQNVEQAVLMINTTVQKIENVNAHVQIISSAVGGQNGNISETDTKTSSNLKEVINTLNFTRDFFEEITNISQTILFQFTVKKENLLENILKASPDSLKSVFILELLTCKMKFMSIVTESKINKAEFQEFFDFLTSDTIWTKAFGEKFSKIKRDILKVKKDFESLSEGIERKGFTLEEIYKELKNKILPQLDAIIIDMCK